MANFLSSPTLLSGDDKLYIPIAWADKSKRCTIGSSIPSGNFFLAIATFSLTSFAANLESVPYSNSIVVCDTPSLTVEDNDFIPARELTASSIGIVIKFSISCGDAPVIFALILTIGKSTSGFKSTPNLGKA